MTIDKYQRSFYLFHFCLLNNISIFTIPPMVDIKIHRLNPPQTGIRLLYKGYSGYDTKLYRKSREYGVTAS